MIMKDENIWKHLKSWPIFCYFSDISLQNLNYIANTSITYKEELLAIGGVLFAESARTFSSTSPNWLGRLSSLLSMLPEASSLGPKLRDAKLTIQLHLLLCQQWSSYTNTPHVTSWRGAYPSLFLYFDTRRKVAGSIPDDVLGLFSCDLILVAALWPWDLLNLWYKLLPRISLG
jgi:hypothetical protein